MKTILVSIALCLSAFFTQAQCNTSAPQTYIIAGQGRPQDIYQITPNPLWKGGDTLKIPAGYYNDVIEFDHVHGDPCHPVTIINDGGLVSAVTIRLKSDCQYVHLTGTGVSSIPYGFKCIGGPLSGDWGKYIEIDHVEVDSALAGYGVVFKTVQDTGNANTIYKIGGNNYLSVRIHLHDNWIHYTGNEGMYIGATDPMGGNVQIIVNKDTTYPLPLRIDSVEIDHNLIEYTGWDGIQLSNARDGCSIHDNVVKHFGMANASSQQAGIISGGNTNSVVYNNKITDGSGNALEAFGYGTLWFYNNTVDSTGNDYATVGQSQNDPNHIGQAEFFSNDYVNTVEVDPKMRLVITNNFFAHPQSIGAIQIDNEHNNSLPSEIDSNIFCIPNAGSNWQSKYIISPIAGSEVLDNTLSPICNEVLALVTPPRPVHLIEKPLFNQVGNEIEINSKVLLDWQLVTMQGQTLERGEILNGYIDLSKYAIGMYIFSSRSYTTKVIRY